MIDRRAFIGSCVCGVGLLAGCASVAALHVPISEGRLRVRRSAHPALAETGGSLRLAPGGSRDTIHLLASGNGEFVALSSTCTHRACAVDVQGERLVCPRHGSTFDRTGAVLRGPAERPLTRYTVNVTDEWIEVVL